MLRHFTFYNNGYNTSSLASSILHHHLSESPSWFYPKYNIHNFPNATKRRSEISWIFTLLLQQTQICSPSIYPIMRAIRMILIYHSIPRLFSQRSPLPGFCKEPKYLCPEPVLRRLSSVTDIGPPQDRIYIYPRDSLESYTAIAKRFFIAIGT